MAAGRRRLRWGFTLLEVVVATALAAMAGAAVLLGVTSSLQATDAAWEETVALGLAQQLMDEVLGARYAAPGAGGRQTWLGPSHWERRGRGRYRYNDIDDYNGFVAEPPTDPWGVPLGEDGGRGRRRHPRFRLPPEKLHGWRQEVRVYYVAPPDWQPLPRGQTSDYRAVEVRIVRATPGGGRRQLALLRQVLAYVRPND
ncbi:MAG TPA: hypothetical protein EYP56_12700 [Planctomycetaceae bacterium]|nr:hypothetical protein [Planctomycetaceae bacterium]HIQ23340.1 hypothetical protein [Planctomycetota bacterium]